MFGIRRFLYLIDKNTNVSFFNAMYAFNPLMSMVEYMQPSVILILYILLFRDLNYQ